jgi:esterase/lipase superfamily enzyme
MRNGLIGLAILSMAAGGCSIGDGKALGSAEQNRQLAQYVEKLTSPDAEARRAAADALMEMGPLAKAAADALRVALGDADPAVRATAADALESVVTTGALIETFRDAATPEARLAAAEALAQIGWPAIPGLRNALGASPADRLAAAVLILYTVADYDLSETLLISGGWFPTEQYLYLSANQYPTEQALEQDHTIAEALEQAAGEFDRTIREVALIALVEIRLSEVAPEPLLPESASAWEGRSAVVDVFYATDRRMTAPEEHYSGERGSGALSFGIAEVSIPPGHRKGELESASWWKLEFRADASTHVVLQRVKQLHRAAFTRQLLDSLNRSPGREALVFVHGYNVSFVDAVRRTGALAYDLEFPGVPITYSWPSEGELFRYTVDESNVEWTVGHFRAFLDLVRREVGARTVHVIAHSMGNRPLIRALESLVPEAGADVAPLREVVFAAPDIDASTFRDLAHQFYGRAERFTLYASSNDEALKASQSVHRYQRAGDTEPEPVVIEGVVDTIDASAIETDFLGHSYALSDRALLTDLHSLIVDAQPPTERYGLKRHPLGHWSLAP